MANGDPPACAWSDAFGYMPWVIFNHPEPLGEPFQTILHDHLWDLYARDMPALWFWADP